MRLSTNRPMGRSPGRSQATRQREPASDMNPVSSAEISPARMSDDLPQPDGPRMARKRSRCNLCRSSSVCFSRP